MKCHFNGLSKSFQIMLRKQVLIHHGLTEISIKYLCAFHFFVVARSSVTPGEMDALDGERKRTTEGEAAQIHW